MAKPDARPRRIDDERHMQRFRPRTSKSYWSAVNTAKAKALIATGRMAPPGLAAFERRDTEKTRRYSSKQPVLSGNQSHFS